MCFAPEADLVAGVVVTAIGVDTLRRTSRRELLPLAALPLVFGVHQLIETLVWWNLRGEVSDCVGRPAAWIYALIALCIVPVLVPVAFVRADAISSRPLARLLVAAGVVSATILFLTLLFGTMHAGIKGHHIDYHVGTPWLPFTLGLYVVATCAPGLLANSPPLRVFGAANLVVVVLLMWLAQSALVSLWCVWAAISSVLINVHVRRRAHTR
ncbi:hypothetical protein ABIE44_002651 [Marmoricola sp. OAE513]|uniref:DUF6629 family protein n=1 Tax=Marmoricola sp. OAE513 TaxID=2817894 RepID=UPI001AE8B612